MIQEGDRRREPRRTFRDAAQAFHDGHHFEAVPEDISVGGMFLKTSAIDDVHAGEVLGVLLDQDSGFDPPLFLYGRVVRIRRSGVPGVGLRWERAGSTGGPAELADALELLFAKPSSAFRPHVVPVTSGRLRSTYDFPRTANGHASQSSPQPGRPAPSTVKVGRVAPPPGRPAPRKGPLDAGPLGLSVTDDELDRLDVKVVHDSQSRQGRNFRRAFDVDAGIVESTPSAASLREGAARRGDDDDLGVLEGFDEITVTQAAPRTSHADRRVPVRIEGAMTVARIEVPVLVTGLAMGSAFAESPLAPLGHSTRVGLRLDLPHRDGIQQVWIDCAVERIHEGEYGTPPGVEFKILSFDEPEKRDELARVIEQARSGRR